MGLKIDLEKPSGVILSHHVVDFFQYDERVIDQSNQKRQVLIVYLKHYKSEDDFNAGKQPDIMSQVEWLDNNIPDVSITNGNLSGVNLIKANIEKSIKDNPEKSNLATPNFWKDAIIV